MRDRASAPPVVPLDKALRILTRIMESPFGKPADRGAAAAVLVHIERLESEREQVAAALPAEVAGGTLAERVRALATLAAERLAVLQDAHRRVRVSRGGSG